VCLLQPARSIHQSASKIRQPVRAGLLVQLSVNGGAGTQIQGRQPSSERARELLIALTNARFPGARPNGGGTILYVLGYHLPLLSTSPPANPPLRFPAIVNPLQARTHSVYSLPYRLLPDPVVPITPLSSCRLWTPTAVKPVELNASQSNDILRIGSVLQGGVDDLIAF